MVSLQRILYSHIFQNAIAAIVLIRTSNSPAFTIRSHISVIAFSSSLRILRRLQTRIITCFGRIIGTKSILNLMATFISFTSSFQSLRERLSTLLMLNSSKQFSFQKQAEQMEYPAIFAMERMFLCFSLFSFLRYYDSSPSSWFFISFACFSWFIILRIVRKRAAAISLMLSFSPSTKQQSQIIFFPFLQDLSNLASRSSSIPPLSRVLEYRLVNLFSRRSYPSQCMTSLSQLMGWTSTKVHQRIPQTLAPFYRRTECDLHFGHSIKINYHSLSSIISMQNECFNFIKETQDLVSLSQ